MSAKQEDRKTNERGLELAYLGDLKARALGRCVAIDLAFVYASERFLAFDGWPAYAKIAAGDGASVLAETRRHAACRAHLSFARLRLAARHGLSERVDRPAGNFCRRGRRARGTGAGHAGRATDHLGVGREGGRSAYSPRNGSRACDGRADRAGRGAITSSASQPPSPSAAVAVSRLAEADTFPTRETCPLRTLRKEVTPSKRTKRTKGTRAGNERRRSKRLSTS